MTPRRRDRPASEAPNDSRRIEPVIEHRRHPLSRTLVLASGVVTFADEPHLPDAADAQFLLSIEDCFCAYGADDCAIYPFTCAFTHGGRLPTCRQVLDAVAPRWFSSEHIGDLDVSSIPYPGYQPGTKNDEIHTDPSEQAMFSKEGDNAYTERLHAELRRRVVDGHLYYVLLHDSPLVYDETVLDYVAREEAKRPREDGAAFSDYVVLFALGVSRESGNIIGILTHQVCHNYCD